MDMQKMKERMFIAGGLIGLPAITWALLAWEPFGRLLARLFPEMFYNEVGRFVPYTPFDALLSTILLAMYAAVPIAAILLVIGVMRSVRHNGAEKTARTVEKGVETTAVGIVYVLSGLWTAVLGIAGWAAREMAAAAEEERQREEENRLSGDSAMEWDEFDWDNRRVPNHSPAIIPDKGLFHDY